MRAVGASVEPRGLRCWRGEEPVPTTHGRRGHALLLRRQWDWAGSQGLSTAACWPVDTGQRWVGAASLSLHCAGEWEGATSLCPQLLAASVRLLRQACPSFSGVPDHISLERPDALVAPSQKAPTLKANDCVTDGAECWRL